jgi:hypothetical protein
VPYKDTAWDALAEEKGFTLIIGKYLEGHDTLHEGLKLVGRARECNVTVLG